MKQVPNSCWDMTGHCLYFKQTGLTNHICREDLYCADDHCCRSFRAQHTYVGTCREIVDNDVGDTYGMV